MIGIIATMKIKEGTNEEFEEVASRLQSAVTENEPGVVYYDWYKGQDDTTYVVFRAIRISRCFRCPRTNRIHENNRR